MQPSGPGKFAKRTDQQGIKRLSDAAYGEQKEFKEQQQGAPMARSNQPVTTGVDIGPGAGREILGMKSPIDNQLQDLSKLSKYMPLFMQYADSPQSTGTMKAFVKYLRSQSE